MKVNLPFPPPPLVLVSAVGSHNGPRPSGFGPFILIHYLARSRSSVFDENANRTSYRGIKSKDTFEIRNKSKTCNYIFQVVSNPFKQVRVDGSSLASKDVTNGHLKLAV